MAGPTIHTPHPPEFERFLYASVGDDRSGCVVTMLSMLARLGLDPWSEAAELAALGRVAAGARLALLLSRFRDVPALGRDQGSFARELVLLLPDSLLRRSPPGAPLRPAGAAAGGRTMPVGTVWTIAAIAIVLALIMFGAMPGAGP